MYIYTKYVSVGTQSFLHACMCTQQFIWTRPTEDSVVQTHVFECFKDYLNTYLDMVKKAQPVTDPAQLQAIRWVCI
jgi:hypothetical protein